MNNAYPALVASFLYFKTKFFTETFKYPHDANAPRPNAYILYLDMYMHISERSASCALHHILEITFSVKDPIIRRIKNLRLFLYDNKYKPKGKNT